MRRGGFTSASRATNLLSSPARGGSTMMVASGVIYSNASSERACIAVISG